MNISKTLRTMVLAGSGLLAEANIANAQDTKTPTKQQPDQIVKFVANEPASISRSTDELTGRAMVEAVNSNKITKQDTPLAETVEAIAAEVAEYGLLQTRQEKLDFAKRVQMMVEQYNKEGYEWASESPKKLANAISWLREPAQSNLFNGLEIRKNNKTISISPKVLFYSLLNQPDLTLTAGTIVEAKKALRNQGQQKAQNALSDSTFHNLEDLVGIGGNIDAFVNQINSSNPSSLDLLSLNSSRK